MSRKRIDRVAEMVALAQEMREPPLLIPDPQERAAGRDWVRVTMALLHNNAAWEAWILQHVPYPTPDENMPEVQLRCRQLRAWGQPATDDDGARRLWHEWAVVWIKRQLAAGITPEQAVAGITAGKAS